MPREGRVCPCRVLFCSDPCPPLPLPRPPSLLPQAPPPAEDACLRALILCPTRELALQARARCSGYLQKAYCSGPSSYRFHLSSQKQSPLPHPLRSRTTSKPWASGAASAQCPSWGASRSPSNNGEGEGGGEGEGPATRRLHCSCFLPSTIYSPPPHTPRLLGYAPEIVVATPGRLWELMSAGEPHLARLDRLSFLVLDEADRMTEQGHFQVGGGGVGWGALCILPHAF